MTLTQTSDSAVDALEAARAVIADRLAYRRSLPSWDSWDDGYEAGVKFAFSTINNAINDRGQRPLPVVNADVLGRAIREHRQAEFDPHAVISMTHLCFDDCAENIAARYDDLASR